MTEQPQQSRPPLQILVADDKNVIRTGLHHIIKRVNSSLDILEAANGLQAWEMIRSSPDMRLAFVDIRMPGLDGLQLCEKIRTEGYTVRVVIVSAFREFDYARQALRYGVSDYLLKPVNPADVVRLVNEAVSSYQVESVQEPRGDEGQTRLLVERVRTWIHDHLDKEVTLAELAEKMHYTPNYLSLLFKKEIGKGFQEYLTDCRMQRAAQLLKDPSYRMAEIAMQVGYTNVRAFSVAFRKMHGVTPTEYREKNGINTMD